MPTFFEIALDYLPIQASSVPSKCVFSSSTEMDTKKQNHINPELMEALHMLKFALLSSNLVSTSLSIGSHCSQCCENRILSLIGISLLIFLSLTPRTWLIELYRRMVMTMMIQPEQKFLYYVHFFRTLSGLPCFCTICIWSLYLLPCSLLCLILTCIFVQILLSMRKFQYPIGNHQWHQPQREHFNFSHSLQHSFNLHMHLQLDISEVLYTVCHR